MRRNTATKRPILADARYNSELLARMINMVMYSGKKSTAENIVYGALDIIAKKVEGTEPLEVFFQALENAKPQVKVKTRRVGGANYQVPVEVPSKLQVAIAMRWVIGYSRGKKGRPMHQALANELIDAFNGTGSSVKKKDDTHRMAQANKAFAHYRF